MCAVSLALQLGSVCAAFWLTNVLGKCLCVQRYRTAPSALVRRKVAVCQSRCKFALSKSINTRVQTPTQCCCVFMRRGEFDDENGFG